MKNYKYIKRNFLKPQRNKKHSLIKHIWSNWRFIPKIWIVKCNNPNFKHWSICFHWLRSYRGCQRT